MNVRKVKSSRQKALTRFVFAFLFICLSFGCNKNDDPTVIEITTDSKEKLIKYETEQIEFEFCLLNLDGISETIFNKGDNIIFSFSFKNSSGEQIIATTEFVNNSFFNVFNGQNNIEIGRPWTGLWCEFSGAPQELKVNPDSKIKISCPWFLDQNNFPVYPLCMSESKIPLETGEYYTTLDLDFHYKINSKTNIIDKTRLIIHFKVI